VTLFVHAVGNIFLVLCAFMSLAFVVIYQLTANWRATQVGRHLMAIAASETAILLSTTIRLFFGTNVYFELVRLLIFLSFPVVLAWRLVILWKYQVKPQMEARRIRRARHLDDRSGSGGLPPEEQR
jgi:hypothetical protein